MGSISIVAHFIKQSSISVWRWRACLALSLLAVTSSVTSCATVQTTPNSGGVVVTSNPPVSLGPTSTPVPPAPIDVGTRKAGQFTVAYGDKTYDGMGFYVDVQGGGVAITLLSAQGTSVGSSLLIVIPGGTLPGVYQVKPYTEALNLLNEIVAVSVRFVENTDKGALEYTTVEGVVTIQKVRPPLGTIDVSVKDKDGRLLRVTAIFNQIGPLQTQ